MKISVLVVNFCLLRHKYVFFLSFLSFRRASWYHKNPSLTNRCTLQVYPSYKPLKFTLKFQLKLLLHVSVYDHHQGSSHLNLAKVTSIKKVIRNDVLLPTIFFINVTLARPKCKLPDDGCRPKHVGVVLI